MEKRGKQSGDEKEGLRFGKFYDDGENKVGGGEIVWELREREREEVGLGIREGVCYIKLKRYGGGVVKTIREKERRS